MLGQEVLAVAIFIGYFALIFLSFFLVFKSALKDVHDFGQLVTGAPFLFVRTALGALLCTWYFMIKFMNTSYSEYAYLHSKPSMPQWLVKTSLFEQAWSVVCIGSTSWWWSSWICTWTVIFSAILWRESSRRGIKHAWAYMLLGQLVAMSVATSLYIVALHLHPRKTSTPSSAPPGLWIPLALAMGTIYLVPQFAGTPRFLNNLLWMHALIMDPLVVPRHILTLNILPENFPSFGIPFSTFYALLMGASGFIHYLTTTRLLESLPIGRRPLIALYGHIFSHPAQSSISFDVIWVFLTLLLWYITSGSIVSIITKSILTAVIAGVTFANYTGVHWGLVVSIVPIGILLAVGVLLFVVQRVRSRNLERRRTLLRELGVEEDVIIAGTDKVAPRMSGKKVVVGFWHPYCNAGGGGERVLWSAIAYLQREEKDVVSLVYTGDYPTAAKDEIISNVNERFSIKLSPNTLHFIPLPSRHLIADNYWSHFTLLGQSLGSVRLAWEGLCGKDGLWGDVFLDSMGYAFTFPFVRMIAGRDIAIGAYVHYPTVSADMVRRVRERSEGVENGGASKSAFKTYIKLLYYKIFTSLYATSLLFSETIMTNSSWTQAHIQSLLTAGRGSLLASLMLMDDLSHTKRVERGEAKADERAKCEVVYPPCDTGALAGLGGLEKRKRELISLAQFRPEKDHAKQLHSLVQVFENHPEYRHGSERITLTLMGGSRGPADEERLSGLRKLAGDLGISDNVEFLVNAPYPEVIRRLGQASIGLNTMQDEHFGINIVEFMAAGLIPVVHASAGPLMDIVVPFKGQQTGFHATTPEAFAESIHQALSLSPKRQLAMRKAAREAAQSKFSLKEFENGFRGGWGILRTRAVQRRNDRERAAAQDSAT